MPSWPNFYWKKTITRWQASNPTENQSEMNTNSMQPDNNIDKKLIDDMEKLANTPPPKKEEHSVDKLWKTYLKMSNIDERRMQPFQLTTMKRAFYGGVGQLLFVQGVYLSKLDDDESQAINQGFVGEIEEFWKSQEQRSKIIDKPKIIT